MIWFVCISVFTVLNFMGWPKLMPYSFLLEYGGVCVLIYIYINTHTHPLPIFKKKRHYMIWFVCILVFTVLNFGTNLVLCGFLSIAMILSINYATKFNLKFLKIYIILRPNPLILNNRSSVMSTLDALTWDYIYIYKSIS